MSTHIIMYDQPTQTIENLRFFVFSVDILMKNYKRN